MALPKTLGVFSIILIASGLIFAAWLQAPVGGTIFGRAPPPNAPPPPEVCDVKINVAGTWKEGFPARSTVTQFINTVSVVDCKPARNYQVWFPFFNIPLQANIFPVDFTLKADLLDANRIVRYSSAPVKVDVPALQTEFRFQTQIVINGVLENTYTANIYSNIGFDGNDELTPKTISVRVP